MKILVSGGGTGGHFFPALALLEFLTEKGIKAKFIGSQRGIEYKLRERIPVESLFLPSHPFMGRSLKDKIKAVVKNLKSAIEIAKFIKGEDKAIVFGGYASLPLGIASFLKGIPLYVHEQNSIPSQSNKLMSKFAKRIFITFEYSKRFFPAHKTIKTGLPVRKSLLEGRSISKEEALKKLDLENLPTLLVMGGSQGASFLNEIAREIFSKTDWQGIHITGERDYEKIKNFYEEKKLRVLAFAFSHDMHLVYKASTIALTRAGASSITELSLYGIPSLFIPFPYAIYDHQFYNAKEIEELGGGITLRQEEASLEKVIANLERLLSDFDAYSKNISTFSSPVACNSMVKYIIE